MQNKNREAPFFYRKEEIEGEDRPLEASEATFQRHCSPGCVSVCLCVRWCVRWSSPKVGTDDDDDDDDNDAGLATVATGRRAQRTRR